MPLFSEHITNMYYSGTPSYSAPSYSYSAPLGSSYSASYLNPGSHYSKHSSLGGYSRPPITPRWTPSSGRSYNPILSTISERSTSSPVRINSPRRVHVPKRTYALSTYTPRPIHINTADIDVSRDRYRPSPAFTPSSVVLPTAAVDLPSQSDAVPNDSIDAPVVDNGPFMPRVDGKPETGIDSSPGGHQRSTIKRGRTVVRLHTVKRKERDSPRKPVDSAEDVKQKTVNASDDIEPEPETSQRWREKLSEDLVYKDKREKKTLGAKLVEKFILKDKEDDEDFVSVRKDSLKKKEDETYDIVESLPLPVMDLAATCRSPDRRCSMELLAEQANVLDSLIRSENLSMATLDLTKVGIDEDSKSDQSQMQSSIKRRKSRNEENPLQTTKSDHSIHDRMKSLRDSRDKHFSKRRSLKKSASGGSLRRLDSITEFPRELPLMNLPAIEENRQSIKSGSIKDKPEPITEEIVKPESMPVKIEDTQDKSKPIVEAVLKTQGQNNEPEPVVENPKPPSVKKEEVKEKSTPRAKITSTVEVTSPKSPIKFAVDNVTVEGKNIVKKGVAYNIEEEPNKKIPKQESISKAAKTEDTRLKPATLDTDADAPSPEPDDGNFWSKIGKRETVYLMKRKQHIEENLAKNRRALYWFAEDEEEQQPDNFTDAAGDSKISDRQMPTQDEIGMPSKDQPKKVTEPSIVSKVEPIVKTQKDTANEESNPVSEPKSIEVQESEPKVEVKVESKVEIKNSSPKMDTTITVEPRVEIKQTIEDIEVTLKIPSPVETQVTPIPNTSEDSPQITAPFLQTKMFATKTQPQAFVPEQDGTPANKVSPKLTKTNLSPLTSESVDKNITKIKSLEGDKSKIKKSITEQDLKKNVTDPDKVTLSSEKSKEAISKSLTKNTSDIKDVKKSSLKDNKEIKDKEESRYSSLPSKVEEDKAKPQDTKVAKPVAKPKNKKSAEKVLKKIDKTPPGTCTECKKPLPKSTPPKKAVAQSEHRDVVRKATASIKTKDLDIRRFNDEKPKQTAEVPDISIVAQSEKEDIPNIQSDETKEPTAVTEETHEGEGNKAEIVSTAYTGNNKLAQVDKPVSPKVTPKKPVKVEAAIRPLIATPRPLQKKAPQIIHSSSSSESSSSEESSDEDNSDSSEGSGEFFECENNPDGRTSTGSNDSGFDSSAPTSPAGFVHIKKDCDVNCHRKCEKLTANLCGVNQRLLVEALASRTASKRGGETPGTSTSAAPSTETASEVLLDELESSTSYSLFRKTGRFTPPARSIPRFRKYNIDDFHFIKVLGKGSFGKVLLTELRDTEYYYAVKCLKKDVVLEDDDVECTLIERKVLALGTNHPYLCHLFATFQTDSHLFFVMEYLNGGDLMFHIQQSGRFPESRARFYAAEIVSGLKFLHKRGIVYRDLKLDNILLDYEGHVRIADFGMCKLQIFLDKTADTFCGTPDYMAPEIIKGLKYNQTVDWWSFGVLLYEMLIGQSPFSGCDEDELFWSICNEMPSYPRFLSQEALTILTRLLDKDARTRLGGMDCMHGDVRDQDFFRSISWDRLDRRELETPFKPRVRHPLDTQYFDRAFTGERPRLTAVEPQVLRSMDQEPFRGFSYTNPNATDR